MSVKKTLVLGASTNPERYSNKAIKMLTTYHHPVIAIGNVAGVEIATHLINDEDIDTVTLYLNPTRQLVYYDYIISLHPKRIIFNPGTENMDLEKLAHQHHIKTIDACTLVMLSTNQY